MLSSTHRRRFALPLALCAILVLVGAVVVRHHHVQHAVKTGDPLPVMKLTDMSGNAVDIQPSQRGVTIYNIFTTWCPGCQEETPAFARFAADARKHGIRVIGIDQGEPPGPISAFSSHFKLTYPIVIDTARVTNAILGARVIPETVVVKDGIVKAINVGPMTPQALASITGTV